ncbi:enoyl-CoA hydratase/isomerase family protein [Hwanghaeella sp.]|uniref:enoyl-CoA hydratase/isomerase family protein n=1 Tax=Hwanghaeella sp. TaxID=2605943 RepID=UPI003CCB7CA8
MPYQTITLNIGDDGVARIVLNRPDAANALDLQMTLDLMDAAIELDHEPSARCIVMEGAGGRFFCAGGDLSAFEKAGDKSAHLVKAMTTNLHSAMSRLARGDAPVIAKVAGTAAGGGLSVALGCDLIIASDEAKFTMAYTRAGLSPDGSSTFYLPRLVGLRRAYDLALTNRVLSAAEAEDWGLINRVVPASELDAFVDDMATQLAAGPTAAFGRTKRLLLEGSYSSLETQMERESRAIAESVASVDGKEGLNAFLNKRKPSFNGQ